MQDTPRNAKTKWIIGIAATCILLYLGVQNIGVIAKAISWVFSLLSPLLMGIAFALILNVPMGFFEDHLFQKTQKPRAKAMRRPIAIVLSFLLVLGILAGVIGLVIPALVEAVKILADSVANIVKTLSSMTTEELAAIPFGKFLISLDWQKWFSALETFLQNQGSAIMNTAVGTIGSVLGGIINVFIAAVFSVYILANKEKLKRQLCRLIGVWLPKAFGDRLIHAASVASGIFRNFVSGQTLEALILGTLCLIGMLILKIPYAPTVSALVGVTALIPVVGAFIGAIVGAFMILTVSPIKAVIFVAFLLILQQLEGNLIYPKVMGSRVNLPAMWVLAAVTIGGGLAGAVGMLLGVPIASTLYILLKEATDERAAATEQTTDRPS